MNDQHLNISAETDRFKWPIILEILFFKLKICLLPCRLVQFLWSPVTVILILRHPMELHLIRKKSERKRFWLGGFSTEQVENFSLEIKHLPTLLWLKIKDGLECAQLLEKSMYFSWQNNGRDLIFIQDSGDDNNFTSHSSQ